MICDRSEDDVRPVFGRNLPDQIMFDLWETLWETCFFFFSLSLSYYILYNSLIHTVVNTSKCRLYVVEPCSYSLCRNKLFIQAFLVLLHILISVQSLVRTGQLDAVILKIALPYIGWSPGTAANTGPELVFIKHLGVTRRNCAKSERRTEKHSYFRVSWDSDPRQRFIKTVHGAALVVCFQVPVRQWNTIQEVVLF